MDDIVGFFLNKSYDELYVMLEIVYIIGICVTLAFAIKPLPYGKYLTNSLSWTIGGANLWRCFSVCWIIPWIVFYCTDSIFARSYLNILGLGCFAAHYFYRSVIYPFLCMKNASPWPLVTALAGILVCTYNTYFQSLHLLNVHEVKYFGLIGSLGLMLFLIGLFINVYHDILLSNIRKVPSENVETRYQIPYGGLFEYISAANYFGEIIEWWGLAILTRGSAQVLFAIATVSLIGIRGWQTHQYYKQTFGNAYPSSRKAIIPFIL